jgi:hypothetical protein
MRAIRAALRAPHRRPNPQHRRTYRRRAPDEIVANGELGEGGGVARVALGAIDALEVYPLGRRVVFLEHEPHLQPGRRRRRVREAAAGCEGWFRELTGFFSLTVHDLKRSSNAAAQ